MRDPAYETRLATAYLRWLETLDLQHSDENLDRFLRIYAPTSPPVPWRAPTPDPVAVVSTPAGRRRRWPWVVAVVVAVPVVVWAVVSPAFPTAVSAVSSSLPTSIAGPSFDEPLVEKPSHGSGSITGSGDGCLEIVTPSGSADYYLKLKDGSHTVWDAFVSAGSTTQFDVPLGTFDLTHGSGEQWYGWDKAFGPDGTYSETRDTFTFGEDNCWRVELLDRIDGNLDSAPLDYADF